MGRLRYKPGAEEEMAAHPEIVIPNPQQWKGKWQSFFQNEHPIYIEVGTGKGQFVTEMAKAHPQINFIGVEIQTSVAVVAMQKMKESGQKNVALIREDVAKLLDFFEEKELARVYINFTDPWPKNRHEKRRLTYSSFLAIYHQLMGDQGEIFLKTDNQGLFEYSLNSFSAYGCRLKNITFDLHHSDYEGNIMTEYEERFYKRGIPIYRCEAILPTKEG